MTVTGLASDFFQISGDMLSPTATTKLTLFSGTIQPGQVFTYTTTPYAPTRPRRLLLVDDQAGAAVTDRYH